MKWLVATGRVTRGVGFAGGAEPKCLLGVAVLTAAPGRSNGLPRPLLSDGAAAGLGSCGLASRSDAIGTFRRHWLMTKPPKTTADFNRVRCYCSQNATTVS